MSQQTFADLAYNSKKKVTRREVFLQEMQEVIPWEALVNVVRPHYPQGKTGRPPMPLERMLRVYFLQQWFGLSDPGMEEALYDSQSMRRFAGFTLNEDAIPDESTILLFRHLLEKHHLTEKMFATVNELMEKRGLLLRQGTIVDATLIHAPSSTKNESGKRDPEMSSTRKHGQWYFGMKAHIGVDTEHGLVHTVICTAAKVHDSKMMEKLVRGGDKAVYGDKAYSNIERQKVYKQKGVDWRVQAKPKPNQELTELQKQQNHTYSRVRSKVEHPFGRVKNTWGYRKVRYRGLEKNWCQMYSLFMLSNICTVRQFLKPARAEAATS